MLEATVNTIMKWFLSAMCAGLLAATGASAAQQQAAQYELGPGDVVHITVYNNPDLTTEAEIAGNGTITFPLIGTIKIGGLSTTAAQAKIARSLRHGNFIPNAQVNLLVTQYRSQQVAVLGAVNKPGKYPITRPSTVTDLLAEAGGVRADGAQIITVTRHDADGKVVHDHIDVSRVLTSGRSVNDEKVTAGDIIYVPTAPVFYIYGQVQKPGAYPLKANITVREALAISGGLTIRGTENGIRIDHRGPDGKVITEEAPLSTVLHPNDVVHVPESWF
jgi:polysaccharide export outer membrane protein